MTHSVVQQSFLTGGRIYSRRRYISDIYQVVVNTEDGGSYEYEVEADSYGEAAEIAEQRANDLMEDITFIEVYHFN